MDERLLVPTLISALGPTAAAALSTFAQHARDTWEDQELLDSLYRLVLVTSASSGHPPVLDERMQTLDCDALVDGGGGGLLGLARELATLQLRKKPGYRVYRDDHDQQVLNLILLADLADPGCMDQVPALAERFLELPSSLGLARYARVVLVFNVAIFDEAKRGDLASQVRKNLEAVNRSLLEHRVVEPRIYVLSESGQSGPVAQDEDDMTELMALLLEVLCNTDIHADPEDVFRHRYLVSTPDPAWDPTEPLAVDAYASFGAVCLHVPLGAMARLCGARDFVEFATVASQSGVGKVKGEPFEVESPEYADVYDRWVRQQEPAPKLGSLEFGFTSLFEDHETLVDRTESIVGTWVDLLSQWAGKVEQSFEDVIGQIRVNAHKRREEALWQLADYGEGVIREHEGFLGALLRLLRDIRDDLEGSLGEETRGGWPGVGAWEAEWYGNSVSELREALWSRPNYTAIGFYTAIVILVGVSLGYLLGSALVDRPHSLVYALVGMSLFLLFIVVPLSLYPHWRVLAAARQLRQERDDWINRVWMSFADTAAGIAKHWHNRNLHSLMARIDSYDKTVRLLSQAIDARARQLLKVHNDWEAPEAPLVQVDVDHALDGPHFADSTFTKVVLPKDRLQESVITHSVGGTQVLGALRDSELSRTWSALEPHDYVASIERLIEQQYSQYRNEDLVSGATVLRDRQSMRDYWAPVSPSVRVHEHRAIAERRDTQLQPFSAVAAQPALKTHIFPGDAGHVFDTIHTRNRIYLWRVVYNIAFRWLDLG